MIRRPPTSTLFPYTTLFRSQPLVRQFVGLEMVIKIFVFAIDDGIVDGHGFNEHGVSVFYRRRCHHDQSRIRSEEHTSELQSRQYLVCRLLLEKKKKHINII